MAWFLLRHPLNEVFEGGMMRSTRIAAVCAALTLASMPAAVTAQPQSQSAGSTGSSGSQQTAGTTARGAGSGPSRTDALAALQDARTTLASLTEASMSHDAREALARVSTGFRALYKAYTGEEPTPTKTAAQAAASMKEPDVNWQTSYAAVSSAVDGVVGRATSSGHSGAVATSGTTGTSSGAYELTTRVRQDFEVLAQQLERFHKAAGGATTTGGEK